MTISYIFLLLIFSVTQSSSNPLKEFRNSNVINNMKISVTNKICQRVNVRECISTLTTSTDNLVNTNAKVYGTATESQNSLAKVYGTATESQNSLAKAYATATDNLATTNAKAYATATDNLKTKYYAPDSQNSLAKAYATATESQNSLAKAYATATDNFVNTNAKVYGTATESQNSLAKAYATATDNLVNTNAKVYGTATDDTANTNTNKLENIDKYIFFRLNQLKNGSTIHLPKLETHLPPRYFVPQSMASYISLTSIHEITQKFPNSYPKNLLDSMSSTLFYCNAPPIIGETKTCTKSLEDLINFPKLVLGGNKLRCLTLESNNGSNSEVKIRNVKTVNTNKIVACHEFYLPFASYYCHEITPSKLYLVDIMDVKTGVQINSMIAICHLDTSRWPADHLAFHILKSSPGQGEACHWLQNVDLTWISSQIEI